MAKRTPHLDPSPQSNPWRGRLLFLLGVAVGVGAFAALDSTDEPPRTIALGSAPSVSPSADQIKLAEGLRACYANRSIDAKRIRNLEAENDAFREQVEIDGAIQEKSPTGQPISFAPQLIATMSIPILRAEINDLKILDDEKSLLEGFLLHMENYQKNPDNFDIRCEMVGRFGELKSAGIDYLIPNRTSLALLFAAMQSDIPLSGVEINACSARLENEVDE